MDELKLRIFDTFHAVVDKFNCDQIGRKYSFTFLIITMSTYDQPYQFKLTNTHCSVDSAEFFD